VIYSPGPSIFKIFGFELRWYGFLTCLSFFLGSLLLKKLLKNHLKTESEREALFDLVFVVFFSGIIGARLWFCLLKFGYYKTHLLEILQIWQGGQSIQGGLILGSLSGFIFYLLRKRDFRNPREISDKISIVLPLSQAIGRLGNFFNIEAFGGPSNLPWSIYVPVEKRPVEYLEPEFFHPTFFYESIVLFLLFLLMSFLDSHKKKLKLRTGTLICFYLVFYSFIRFFLENFRLDSLYLFRFPAPQVVCLLFILVNSLVIIFMNKSSQAKKELT